MKTRIVLVLLLAGLLALSTGAVASSAPPRYRIEVGTLPGGDAPVTETGVRAGVISAGGAYRLETRSVSASEAYGCCCTWLPCVLLQY